MKVLYIIAHTYELLNLTIEVFYTPEKTIKRLGELTDNGFERKPDPNDDPDEYLIDYYLWIELQNDNECESTIILEKIRIYE